MKNGFDGKLSIEAAILVAQREAKAVHDHPAPIDLRPEIVDRWESRGIVEHPVDFELRLQLARLHLASLEFNGIEIAILEILNFENGSECASADLAGDLVFRVENVANLGVGSTRRHIIEM
jgi:hypothetical protein